MTALVVRAHVALLHAVSRPPSTWRRGRGDGGQTTAEYALVLLGAAGIALLLVGWAAKSGAIGKLFDLVMVNVMGKVK